MPEPMERDVERYTNGEQFVALLRRIADAVEAGESFRIQVANHRFTVPAGAEMSVEHEAADGDEELELQFRWSTSD